MASAATKGGGRADQAEKALHQAQAELAHVTRVTALRELAASIAHEVNQPLAAVVTNAGACLRWLASQPPDLEEARQALGRILKDGNRAGEIIGRIRAFVKKSPARKDWLDINETILEVIALTRSEVHGNRVSLQTQLSNHLPLILGDRIQVQQVILNLSINAIEAMSGVGDGPRELLVGSRKDESNSVLVAVRDSGKGWTRRISTTSSTPSIQPSLMVWAWAGDQPFDYRGPWRAALGDAERAPWRHLSAHAAG